MKVKVFGAQGEDSVLELPKQIDQVKVGMTLLHQAVVAEAANKRVPHAHTKNRGDVRGGGKKPWRQKGTGNARAGSRRSPLWVGGGIVFGPTPARNFKLNMPQKMRNRAFAMAMVAELKAQSFRIIDAWPADLQAKTKAFVSFLTKLPDLGKHILVITEGASVKILVAATNIPYLKLKSVKSVSTSDLLNASTIIASRDGFNELLTRAFGLIDLDSAKADDKETK